MSADIMPVEDARAEALREVKVERACRRFLRVLIDREPTYTDEVSDGAFASLVARLNDLDACAPEDLLNPAGSSGALRRYVRLLPTLWPRTGLDECAERIRDLANNPNLPLHVVREVLAGFEGGKESPVPVYQRIADLLRDGATHKQVARAVNVNPKVVESVSAFVGAFEARKQRISAAAVEAKAAGHTIQQFADDQGIGYTWAQRLLADAAEILAEETWA